MTGTDLRALLLILDGAGWAEPGPGNVVSGEHMPFLFECMERQGFAVLEAAGGAVGLEPGQVGNSEAGHVTIGAGRTVPSLLVRIHRASVEGHLAADHGWGVAREAGILHLVGLVSDAGVHGLTRTIVECARAASEAGVAEIRVHPVLDGVDSVAGSARRLLAELEHELASVPGAEFGVVQGRRWFCDRSGDLEVSRVAVAALTGETTAEVYTASLLTAHLAAEGESSFPAHLWPGGRTIGRGEPVLITSHRADRARQVATLLGEHRPLLMLVDPGAGVQADHVFFPQRPLERGLAHELSRHGFASRRIAEKCKFPHVTFFLNGFDAGIEGDGCCIPSIPEAEIRARPEMSIDAVTEALLEVLSSPTERVALVNLANLDQVGHLGNPDAGVRAAKAVDAALERIAVAGRENGWTLLVTADHGNAERVLDEAGEPFGSHTTNPVPFTVLPAPGLRAEWSGKHGTLGNVAASVLLALGQEPPDWMDEPLVRFVD